MVNDAVPAVGIGTHYPNRLFVGSLPGSASATDLAEFFKKFGTVLEGKVVLDINGNSRRFGFVTFATNEDVKRVLCQGVIFFRGKQINVGPAVKRLVPDNHTSVAFAPSEVAVRNPVHCSATPVCKMHHVPEPLTPPLSPVSSVSPINGQNFFLSLGQFSPKNVFPSVHLASAQPPYVISCSRIPLPTTVTNLHLPRQNIPMPTSPPVIPVNEQMQQTFKAFAYPAVLPANKLKPSLRVQQQVPVMIPYLKQR